MADSAVLFEKIAVLVNDLVSSVLIPLSSPSMNLQPTLPAFAASSAQPQKSWYHWRRRPPSKPVEGGLGSAWEMTTTTLNSNKKVLEKLAKRTLWEHLLISGSRWVSCWLCAWPSSGCPTCWCRGLTCSVWTGRLGRSPEGGEEDFQPVWQGRFFTLTLAVTVKFVPFSKSWN